MRRIAITALCLLLSWTSIAHSQSSDQALKDFRAQILKNQFILRGFSDDPVTTFQWNGTELSFSEPKLHTLGTLTPVSVELRANKLEIAGVRRTLVKEEGGPFKLLGGSRAEITVDLQDSDASQVLPALKAALFFPTPQAAFEAIPTEDDFIFKAKPEYRPKNSKDPPLALKKKVCPVEVKRPTILYQPEAEYSEEARRAAFSGSVEFAVIIGEDGLPSNVWLVRPAGMGLDENAADAVLRYKFRPATCDGKPVKTMLIIDVNFLRRAW